MFLKRHLAELIRSLRPRTHPLWGSDSDAPLHESRQPGPPGVGERSVLCCMFTVTG